MVAVGPIQNTTYSWQYRFMYADAIRYHFYFISFWCSCYNADDCCGGWFSQHCIDNALSRNLRVQNVRSFKSYSNRAKIMAARTTCDKLIAALARRRSIQHKLIYCYKMIYLSYWRLLMKVNQILFKAYRTRRAAALCRPTCCRCISKQATVSNLMMTIRHANTVWTYLPK